MRTSCLPKVNRRNTGLAPVRCRSTKRRRAASRTPPAPAAGHRAAARRDRKREEAERRRRLQPLRRRLETAEAELERLQAERTALEQHLADPQLYTDDSKPRLKALLLEKADLDGRCEAAEVEWLAAAEALEAVTGQNGLER